MSKSILKGNLALFYGHKFIIFILSSAIVGLAKLTGAQETAFLWKFFGFNSVESKKKKKSSNLNMCGKDVYDMYSPIWLTWNFTIYIKIYVTLFSRLVPPISLAIDSV